jgi:hypothetical protein
VIDQRVEDSRPHRRKLIHFVRASSKPQRAKSSSHQKDDAHCETVASIDQVHG